MAQSLSQVSIHVVFSTKNRIPSLTASIRTELFPYMATVLKGLACPATRIGGTDNHVHILCTLSKNMSVAKLVEEIKKPTSKWLKSKGTALGQFRWQNGYGAFSVSQSDVKRVKAYVSNQEEHHCELTFEDEFRRLLERHEIDYDERYVWD